AKDRNGRVDSDTGAVPIAGLKGEAKANAILKAITKAKRRVTLSMVGLGMLDESEVETIPGARVVTGGELPAPRQPAEQPAPAAVARDVPRLSAEKALSLTEKLEAAGVDNAQAFASDVLGRQVRDLRDLTTAEALRVFESLPDQDEEVVDTDAKPVAEASAPADIGEFPPEPPEGLFPEEKPKGKRARTLTGPEAQRLHKKLGAVGLPQDEHYAFVSAVLGGVVVTTLTQLT